MPTPISPRAYGRQTKRFGQVLVAHRGPDLPEHAPLKQAVIENLTAATESLVYEYFLFFCGVDS